MKFKEIIKCLEPHITSEELENIFTDTSFNDTEFVKTASAHLVLPAIYFNLKNKGVIGKLPQELASYLEEIFKLNKERNNEIIAEIKFISQLFISSQIEHAFTKGAALLISGYLPDTGVRMVGDIDVLINTNHLEKAKTVLVQEGYFQFYSDIPYEYLDEHQMGRLISKSKIAAVELHRRLLFYGENESFNFNNYLRNKINVNGIFIGNAPFLTLHTIYNMQCNDFAYYYNTLNLKTIADFLILKEYYGITDEDLINKYLKNFIDKFQFITDENFKAKGSKMYLFKIAHKYPFTRNFINNTLKLLKKIWFFSKAGFKLFTNADMRRAYIKHKQAGN